METLNGLFAVLFAAALYFPTLILAAVGWWAGRRLAFQTLSKRFVLRLVIGVVIFAVVMWIWRDAPYSMWRSGAVGLLDIGVDYVVELAQAFGIVLAFAALAWAMNLDDFWTARRVRKEQQQAEPEGADV